MEAGSIPTRDADPIAAFKIAAIVSISTATVETVVLLMISISPNQIQRTYGVLSGNSQLLAEVGEVHFHTRLLLPSL